MPSFIPERGSTLHLVGVCVNRIGREGSSPIYEERYCAFIDILGFTEMIGRLKSGAMTYIEMRDLLVSLGSSRLIDVGFDQSGLRLPSVSSDAI